jgi:hypothetical protein
LHSLCGDFREPSFQAVSHSLQDIRLSLCGSLSRHPTTKVSSPRRIRLPQPVDSCGLTNYKIKLTGAGQNNRRLSLKKRPVLNIPAHSLVGLEARTQRTNHRLWLHSLIRAFRSQYHLSKNQSTKRTHDSYHAFQTKKQTSFPCFSFPSAISTM